MLIGGIQFVSDLPYMRDFFDLDDLEHEEIDIHAAPYPEYGIEFKNVSFAYPNTDRTVLKDINVTIKPGEKVAIVGENGSGKTTFVICCAVFIPPQQRQHFHRRPRLNGESVPVPADAVGHFPGVWPV